MSQALHCQFLNTSNFRLTHLCIPNSLFAAGMIKGCGVKRGRRTECDWCLTGSSFWVTVHCVHCQPVVACLESVFWKIPPLLPAPALSIATRSCWTFLIANNPLSQVLRNAGSKVQLLIARDLTNDNHLSSPALSQDSLDGKVGVSNVSCQRRILAETQMSHLISSFLSSSTTWATTTSSASSSRKTAAAWASPFQATSATWIQVIKSEVGGSDCERIPPCVFFFSISHSVFSQSIQCFLSDVCFPLSVQRWRDCEEHRERQHRRPRWAHPHRRHYPFCKCNGKTKKEAKNKKKKQKAKDGFLSALPNYK